MQYTESEREAWRQVDSFFEPDGVLDEDACEKYYATHLSRKMEPDHIAHKKGELLFALMKKTIAMDQAKKTFARVYNAIRSVSPRLQIFLNHIAEKEPDVLRTWLKETSLEADITSQILLLRDVKLWLPHDDVGLYTNAAILKMKPSAFVKKFTPEVSDMATLLEVAQDFQTKPKYAHLGLLMQQGIFIALYGKEHEPRGFDENTLPSIGELLEIKYSARAAFDLMQSNGIRLPPSELMTLIKSRYRAQCLESDALAYAYESLNPDVSEEKREYGLQVLDTVLQAQTQRPDFLYNTGLLYIYAMMEKQVEHDNTEMMQRIKNALLHYIASDKMPARSMQEVITLTPSLTEELLEALQKRAEDHQNQKLLHALFMGAAYHDELYQGIGGNSLQHSEQLYGLAQKRSTAEQVTNLFEHQFNAILSEKSYDGSERDPSCVMGDLKRKTRIFVAHKWPLEKLEHLRNSTVVPK